VLASLGGSALVRVALLGNLSGSLSSLSCSAAFALFGGDGPALASFGRLGDSALVHVASLGSFCASTALASFGDQGRLALVRSLLTPLGGLRGSVFMCSLVLVFPSPGGLGGSADHSSGSLPLAFLRPASSLPWVQPTIWPGGASPKIQPAIWPGGAPTGLGPFAAAVVVTSTNAVIDHVATVAGAKPVIRPGGASTRLCPLRHWPLRHRPRLVQHRHRSVGHRHRPFGVSHYCRPALCTPYPACPA
jgi:hypothetical protein